MSRVSQHLPGFVGGALCLDFANTLDPRHAGERDDFLVDYPRLVEWAGRAGVVGELRRRALLDAASSPRSTAGDVHQRALRLREAIYQLFAPAARLSQPSEETISVFTDELSVSLAARRLGWEAGRWSWTWEYATVQPDSVLWPVVHSAAELLTSPLLDRVRECQGTNGCGWLFLDTSKSGRRRWCDMRVCGNRAKAQRHGQRQRSMQADR